MLDGTRGPNLHVFRARATGRRINSASAVSESLAGRRRIPIADAASDVERIIRGKMLSDDDKLTLMVLALDPSVHRTGQAGRRRRRLRQTLNNDLAGTGLKAELSGVPVMQLEIRNAIQRDRLIYNTLGFAVGCLIAIIFFRRIVVHDHCRRRRRWPPSCWRSACSAGSDFKLNMFLNVMTPLIMVISFSDSMQITFAARDRLIAGDDKFMAFRNALLIVGPACVLTHATAGVSFIALQFSSSDLIRTFGEAGLIAVAVALVAVLMGVPLLGVLLIRNETAFVAAVSDMDTALDWLRRLCSWIAIRMVARPGLYSLLSLLVVVVLSLGYAQLQPRYRLADQVPDREQAVQASHRLDVKLTGANPFDVYIQFPKGASLYAPETLSVIADVHALLEHQKGVGNVWSLDTLRRWLAEKMQQIGRRHAQAICRPAAALSDAPVYFGRTGRGHRQRTRSGFRRQPAAADRRPGRPAAQRRAREISGLQDCGDRPVGDLGAQQRADDRQAERRPHHRDRLRGRVYRPGVLVADRDADQHPAGTFPDRPRRLHAAG